MIELDKGLTTADPAQADQGPMDIVECALAEAKRIRIEAIRAAEGNYRSMTAAAQKKCDDLIAGAERKCEEIVEAAKKEAEMIIEEARLQAERYEAESSKANPGASMEETSGSAQEIVELALEESQHIRLSAMREAQTLRAEIVSRAQNAAAETEQRAQEKARQHLQQAQASLRVVDEEVALLRERFSALVQRLSSPEAVASGEAVGSPGEAAMPRSAQFGGSSAAQIAATQPWEMAEGTGERQNGHHEVVDLAALAPALPDGPTPVEAEVEGEEDNADPAVDSPPDGEVIASTELEDGGQQEEQPPFALAEPGNPGGQDAVSSAMREDEETESETESEQGQTLETQDVPTSHPEEPDPQLESAEQQVTTDQDVTQVEAGDEAQESPTGSLEAEGTQSEGLPAASEAMESAPVRPGQEVEDDRRPAAEAGTPIGGPDTGEVSVVEPTAHDWTYGSAPVDPPAAVSRPLDDPSPEDWEAARRLLMQRLSEEREERMRRNRQQPKQAAEQAQAQPPEPAGEGEAADTRPGEGAYALQERLRATSPGQTQRPFGVRALLSIIGNRDDDY
ncbi:MAG: hypothetical protein M0Z94_17550 [Dehalococcoidales bacterium]|nr:hypothetical protein [Dehalococcoidales bacterium]